MELIPGANAALPAGPVAVEIGWDAGAGLDVSALLLGADGKVRGDADMVFFNNPAAADGAVRFTPGPGAARLDIDPGAIPADVERIAVVAAVDVDAPAGTTFAGVHGVRATTVAGATRFDFALPALDRGETAAVLAEVYRRGTDWKVRAVGQGYASGLAGVAADFGVDVADDDSPAPSPQPAPASAPPGPVAPVPATPVPAPAGPAAPGTKIDLAKGASATISLDKSDPHAVVTATLAWDGGSAERRSRGADLDLYVIFVPADAVTGHAAGRQHHLEDLTPAQDSAVQAADADPARGAVYWNNLGALDRAPHLALDADATLPGTETVRITRPDRHGFMLVCAYSALGNGEGSFRSYGAKAVVTDGHGNTVTAPLYSDNDNAYWVAIALVDFTVPGGVAIRQIEAYSSEHAEGRPVLFPDGSFVMDIGPCEFKDDFDDASA